MDSLKAFVKKNVGLVGYYALMFLAIVVAVVTGNTSGSFLVVLVLVGLFFEWALDWPIKKAFDQLSK